MMSNAIQINQAGIYAATKTSADLSVNQVGVFAAGKTIPDVKFNLVGVYVATKNAKFYCWARQKNHQNVTALTPQIQVFLPS